jgi:hypothetical protein
LASHDNYSQINEDVVAEFPGVPRDMILAWPWPN